jgi:sugar-specific transcriptional regulator TrmB
MINEIKKKLKELNFTENEVNVYISLTQLGESNAAKIAKRAELPRTTVIGILEKLNNDSYITTHKFHGTTFYWIESPKMIKNSLLNKVQLAESLDKLLTELYRDEADFPFAKIYDTKSSIKSFIEKSLLNLEKKSLIMTIDNPHMGHYDKVLSREYGIILVGIKQKRGIITNTLIPNGAFKNIDKEKLNNQNINIKELPENINFQTSLWIIGKTLVLFSGKYPFIVAINHRLITDSFKSLYEYLWNIAELKHKF